MVGVVSALQGRSRATQHPVDWADLTGALASFVPRAARAGLTQEPYPTPRSASGLASVLFADIAGFTALAETVCRGGTHGVERLGEILNDCFGELVELVQQHRGDVVSFHGDGLLAQWPVGIGTAFGAASLAESAHLAVQCAAAIQRAMHRRDIGEGICLSLRISVSTGMLREFHVGTRGGRWTYFIAGAAIQQLRDAQVRAQPGDVVLSAEAGKVVGSAVRGTVLADGPIRLVHVDSISVAAGAPVLSTPLRNTSAWHGYVPAVVHARVLAGQQEWLAELRRVSVLFVNIRGLDYDEARVGSDVQIIVERLQEALRDLQGYFYQLLVDEKGTVFVAGFGVPPFAHEDDAARAVQFAWMVRRTLSDLGLKSNIGVALGRVFSGPLGSSTRRDYAMIGDTMNVCARLMEAADDEVICDEAIAHAAGSGARFEPMQALRLKGKREPVRVFRVLHEGAECAAETTASAELADLFGRDEEQGALRARLRVLQTSRRADALLVQGEPGLGKSRLLSALAVEARAQGLPVIRVEADGIERNTPYRAWRAYFQNLISGGPTPVGADLALQRLSALLEPNSFLLALLPLAAAVLSADLPGTELTASLRGEVRAANTRRLLAELLLGALGGRCAVLIVEDAHWMDSASLAVLREVLSREAPILTLISSRPREREDELVEEMLTHRQIDRMHLRPLDVAATAALLRARLRAQAFPKDLPEQIHARSGGNPFYSEQLLLALRESGALADASGQACRAALETALPGTLEDIVTHRIDRLAPSQQLSIKVASVIGRVFPFGMLRHVHPLQPSDSGLHDDLDALERAELTQLLRNAPESAWMFRHAITQDAAYGLLLFAHRRELHRRVAEWLEAGGGAERIGQLPLLAHHWSRAEQWARAVDCWEEAASHALDSGSDREARRFLDLAAEQANLGALTIAPLRRARWERQHADACLRLGLSAQSMDHAGRALRLLGRPVPLGMRQFVAALMGAVARQFAHRVRPHFLQRGTTHPERFNELALANECFSQGCFFVGDMNIGLVGALRHLNYAEVVGPSATLARAYGLASTSAGIVGLHALARFYRTKALQTLETVRSPMDLGLLQVYFSLNEGASAHWPEMLRLSDEGLATATRCGDRRRLNELHSLHSMGHFYSGAIRQAEEERAALHAAVATDDDQQLRRWALIELAEVALRQGDLEGALAFEDKANELQGVCGRTERVWLEGVRAATQLRRGRPDEALAAARKALQASSEGATQGFYALEGYAGAAETCIELAAVRCTDSSLRRDARRALRGLAYFALSFPMARPRTALLRGRYAMLSGRRRGARRAFLRALGEAQRCGMPFEAGLTHLELATVCDASERRGHLHSGLALLEPLGAWREIARARDALAQFG